MSARELSGRLKATARTSRAKITSTWDRYQIHGRFSIQRIEDLRDYYSSQATWSRVLLVCLVTPLSALVVITLVDCIPLAPPAAGRDANYVFWIRLIPIVWILIAGAIQSFRYCLPTLLMSQAELFAVALLGSLSGVSLAYVVSVFVGFPVPFNLAVQSFSILPVRVLLFRMLWRKSLRAKPSLQADLRQLLLALVGQRTMTYVFPLYLFAFLAMPPTAQLAFALAIPLIKIGLKRFFSRMLRRLDDLKPAFIVFNVNVFSAFYIASCLQATRSWHNTMIVMLIDVVQAAISFHGVRNASRDINALVPVDTFGGSLLDLCIEAAAPPQVRQELNQRVASTSFGTKRHLNFRVSLRSSLPAVFHKRLHPLANSSKPSSLPTYKQLSGFA